MKKAAVFFIVIYLILCIGCNESNNSEIAVDPTQYLLDEKFNTDEYLPEDDVQKQFMESKGWLQKYNGVYYIYSYDTKYIYYYDEASRTSGKLCGKGECTHDTSDCNAYNPFIMNIQIYHGYLYWINTEGNLYRCDLTGNNREAVQKLSASDGCFFLMHRGYVYMYECQGTVQEGQMVNTLIIRQCQLDSKEDMGKIILEEHSTLNTRYHVQIYGNTLYLVTDRYESMNSTEWQRMIRSYHIGSGEWEIIKEETTSGWIRSLYIENGQIQAIEHKTDMVELRGCVRQIVYNMLTDEEVTTEWIEFEPNKTWSTHIMPGYIFMIETAPHTEEGVLKYQLINTDGEVVKEGKAEGLQPMYCGADDTGIFVRFMYSEASESGMKTYFKMVRIPYEAESDVEYLVDDVNILR